MSRLMAVEPPPKKALTRTIPLALADLPPGTLITKEHIGMGPWPADDVKGDVLLSATAPVGRVVKDGIKAATPIHGKSLYAFGELPPLKVSDGYQAVTVKSVDNAHMLNGLVKPGDHVDIKFTLKEMLTDPRVQKLGGLTMTLFRGVRVLAINRDFVQAPLSAAQNSVTVEVHENDANLLLLAAAKGELTLTYTENHSGKAAVAMEDSDRATLEQLLRLEPLPPPPAPPKLDPPQVTDVYRRSGRQVLYFRDGYPSNGAYPPGYNPNGNGAGGANGWNYGNGNNPHPYYGFGDQSGNYYNPNSAGQNSGYGNGPARGSNGAPGIPSTMNVPGQMDPYSGGYGNSYGAPGSWNPGMNTAPTNTGRDRVSANTSARRR